MAACLLVSCSKSPFQLEQITKIELSGEKIANKIVIEDAKLVKNIIDSFVSQKKQKLTVNAEDDRSIYALEFYQDDMERTIIRLLDQDRIYINQMLYQIKGNNDILSYIDQYTDQIIAKKNILKDINMTAKEESISPHGVRITITNSSAYEYSTGECYLLEQFVNEEWIALKPMGDTIFNAIGYRIKGISTLEMNIDWTDYYGILNPGRYRVGKSMLDGNQEYQVYAEFVIK